MGAKHKDHCYGLYSLIGRWHFYAAKIPIVSSPWLGVKFFSPFREITNPFQICLVFTNDFPRIDVVGCVQVASRSQTMQIFAYSSKLVDLEKRP